MIDKVTLCNCEVITGGMLVNRGHCPIHTLPALAPEGAVDPQPLTRYRLFTGADGNSALTTQDVEHPYVGPLVYLVSEVEAELAFSWRAFYFSMRDERDVAETTVATLRAERDALRQECALRVREMEQMDVLLKAGQASGAAAGVSRLQELIAEWRDGAKELDEATRGTWVEPSVRRACADELESTLAELAAGRDGGVSPPAKPEVRPLADGDRCSAPWAPLQLHTWGPHGACIHCGCGGRDGGVSPDPKRSSDGCSG
jgi:hypothetical protein